MSMVIMRGLHVDVYGYMLLYIVDVYGYVLLYIIDVYGITGFGTFPFRVVFKCKSVLVNFLCTSHNEPVRARLHEHTLTGTFLL